jgi:hypothetical protein
LIASVYNDNDKLLHRNFYLEQEWKNINLPEAKLEIEFTEESDLYVSIKSNTPIFFVDLYHPHIKFDARGFILLPGETKKIKVYGDSNENVKADELQVYSLNKYLSS